MDATIDETAEAPAPSWPAFDVPRAGAILADAVDDYEAGLLGEGELLAMRERFHQLVRGWADRPSEPAEVG